MIVKVCGIKYRENLLDLIEEPIHMVGFNFYAKSVRYVEETQDIKGALHLIPNAIKKVGIYVNAEIDEIRTTAEEYQLDFIQLHGDEGPEFVNRLTEKYKIIKVFRIDEDFDFDTTNSYSECAYFLFDTKTLAYGGSGKKFNWAQLNHYQGATPFLLSGGIGPEDIHVITTINHEAFAGIDINSKFEYSPAMKDVKSISEFIYSINNVGTDEE